MRKESKVLLPALQGIVGKRTHTIAISVLSCHRSEWLVYIPDCFHAGPLYQQLCPCNGERLQRSIVFH